jgi:hypothetical protein
MSMENPSGESIKTMLIGHKKFLEKSTGFFTELIIKYGLKFNAI